jgi:Ser/Thr protein kinase RdoA (MazF antagonist)
MPAMFDLAFIEQLVHAVYEADIRSLHPFRSSFVADIRAVCRIDLADCTAWTLRVGRADAPIPDWLVGCGAATTPDWLRSRAATLQYLQEQAYPAPRVVATRSGAAIGQANGWCTFATTFVEGQVADPTPHNLRGIAAALGRLHNIQLDQRLPASARPGQSWWFPSVAIPAVLQQYVDLRQTLPDEWHTTVDAFSATLRRIFAHDLPPAIVHGDGWAGNAVQTATNQTILIDWEPSGLGPAILDLGRLLLHCHQTLAAPTALPASVSPQSIAAVVDGYCQERVPTALERALLLDAIRFSVALGAASHFANAQRARWVGQWREKLTRRAQWYHMSEAIAEIAGKRLEQIL